MTTTRGADKGEAAGDAAPRQGVSRRRFFGAAAVGLLGAQLPREPRAAATPGAAAKDARPGRRQPAGPTEADFHRADTVWRFTHDGVFNDQVDPHWLPGYKRFWYVNRLQGNKTQYILVDAAAGARRAAFDHARLARALSRATRRRWAPDHLDLFIVEDDPRRNVLHFNAAGKGWVYQQQSGKLASRKLFPVVTPPPAFPPQPDHRWSPQGLNSYDGQWSVELHGHNVVLRNRHAAATRQLTHDGTPDHFYGPQVIWSPDSRKFIVMRTQPGAHRQCYEVQWAPPGTVDPRPEHFFYLKPGDAVPILKPCLFDAASGRQIPVNDALFATPWNITQWRWTPDSRRFTFLYNQRGHQVMRLLAVDAGTGRVAPIIDENCIANGRKFFDYSGKLFTWYLDDTHEMLWMSEREGWNHLYLIDTQTGRVKNCVTSGQWVVRHVLHVDARARQVWFTAGGIVPGEDPYYLHTCRVNFDGTHLVRLTHGDGTHTAQFSPDRRYLVDHYSRVDLPPQAVLRSGVDGSEICTLERADASKLLATGVPRPERFVAKGRDGKTDIYGLIFRPRHFDPRKKYPIIEDIYAGPQGSFVPRHWQDMYWQQTVAELGCIVVKIDGMGTSDRSKDFHNVCWRNLGDSGFPDRILWIKAAARRYPYMDQRRVGIYGTSAGGQSALRAVTAFGKFYTVAVANSGCHDNRVDKIWWNEQWMGYPIGPWYAQQSNVTNAGNLHGKVLLIVGGMDHNVDPACTFQVVNALQQHNKQCSLMVFPNGHHGCGGPTWAYMWRLTRQFLMEHLQTA